MLYEVLHVAVLTQVSNTIHVIRNRWLNQILCKYQSYLEPDFTNNFRKQAI